MAHVLKFFEAALKRNVLVPLLILLSHVINL